MRNWVKNGLLLLGAVLFTLFFLEVAFSILYPQKIIKYQQQEKHTQYHELLGWVNKPNFTDKGVLCGKVYSRTINGQGFRDTKEYTIEKTPGKKRVLVLGDSFMFGEEQNDGALYPTYLQDLLGSKYEVYNFGVSGYGTDQEYILLEKNIAYKPDMVIVGFFQNDVFNVLSNKIGEDESRGSKPAFRITKDNKAVLSGCCPVPRAPPSVLLKKSFLEYFHTYMFFKTKIRTLSEKNIPRKSYMNEYHESENTQLKNYSLLKRDYAVLSKFKDSFIVRDTVVETGVHMVAVILNNIKDLGKQHNFSVVVLNIPINTQVDPIARRDYLAQFYDVTENDFQYDKLNQILQAFMNTQKEFTYIDLLPIFEKEGNVPGGKRNIFYPCTRDMHWNALGAKRAAEETVTVLRERKLVA